MNWVVSNGWRARATYARRWWETCQSRHAPLWHKNFFLLKDISFGQKFRHIKRPIRLDNILINYTKNETNPRKTPPRQLHYCVKRQRACFKLFYQIMLSQLCSSAILHYASWESSLKRLGSIQMGMEQNNFTYLSFNSPLFIPCEVWS